MATQTTTALTSGVLASKCSEIPERECHLGDIQLRNRLRATGAHSTLSLDGLEVSPFHPSDIFFMPAYTRGRRVEWSRGDRYQCVSTRHDGFRKLRGSPMHLRCVVLDVAGDELEIWDDVDVTTRDLSTHHVRGWWHWGGEPSDIRRDEHDQAAYGGFQSPHCASNSTSRSRLPSRSASRTHGRRDTASSRTAAAALWTIAVVFLSAWPFAYTAATDHRGL